MALKRIACSAGTFALSSAATVASDTSSVSQSRRNEMSTLLLTVGGRYTGMIPRRETREVDTESRSPTASPALLVFCNRALKSCSSRSSGRLSSEATVLRVFRALRFSVEALVPLDGAAHSSSSMRRSAWRTSEPTRHLSSGHAPSQVTRKCGVFRAQSSVATLLSTLHHFSSSRAPLSISRRRESESGGAIELIKEILPKYARAAPKECDLHSRGSRDLLHWG